MTLHVAGFKLSISDVTEAFDFRRLFGDAPEVPPPPSLSEEQELLRAAYLSGQIEPWAWREHLDDDPVLKARFGDH